MNATQEATRQKTFETSVRSLGPRTSAFTISTGSRDRDGDTIDPKGWELEPYKRNPVVLFGHDSGSLPIGKAVNIWTDSRGLHVEMQWPEKGVYPFADTVHDMVKAGFLNATSVGFLVRESRPTRAGLEITKAELLEFSIVNLPSNPQALVMRRGLNEPAMKEWLGSDPSEINWTRINAQLASRPDVDEVSVDSKMVDLVVRAMTPALVAGALALTARDAAERILNHLSGRID